VRRKKDSKDQPCSIGERHVAAVLLCVLNPPLELAPHSFVWFRLTMDAKVFVALRKFSAHSAHFHVTN
jgi:hypothetical protein